jgi:GTPase SAR1 family protein
MLEFEVLMFGPRRVGKTSLLTSMYYEYDREINKTSIQLTPDFDTVSILGERLGELKALNDDFNEGELGINTTGDPKHFIFNIGRLGETPKLKLTLWDCPGFYLVDKKDPEKKGKKFIEEHLTKSVAVLIAVDAPALMEAKGKFHFDRNQPLAVKAWFQNIYGSLNTNRLVIIAPIKCESYMKDEQSAKKLLGRIKEEYQGLLQLFKSESLEKKVAVVVTPVQTVGNLFFSSIQENNDSYKFIFKKPDIDADYAPKDNEQPLKYLLRFLLKNYLKNRKFGWIADTFGQDDFLYQAVYELAKDCKTNNGFEIIQGKDLFYM